jgi:NAD(P)-dependent dehydrogenase (short-subunit alcohol dehydrogenase family)
VTDLQLPGKVAVVTGAGAGIGRTIAQRFAAEGAIAVVASRTAAEVTDVVATIHEAGGKAHGVVTDVADARQVDALVKKAHALKGHVDVLVNNAGIMDDFTPAADASDELWRKVLGVNLEGPVLRLPRRPAPDARPGPRLHHQRRLHRWPAGRPRRRSLHGQQDGLIGLTKSIGYMYAKTGVRCNAIAPGGVQTTIGSKMHPHPFGYERMSAGLGNVVRVGQPEEVASIAVFLATDASSLVNGAVLTADAGWTAY